MASQCFDKCLTTYLTHGVERVQYILPYRGNLTTAKIVALGKRFADAVIERYAPNFTHEKVQIALTQRLGSEWLTGREKFVHIEPDEHGTFTLKGENWFFYGWPEGGFKVVA